MANTGTTASYRIFSFIMPIDFWVGWVSLEHLTQNAFLMDAWGVTTEILDYEINLLLRAAKASNKWDGDLRDGPYVTAAGILEDDPFLVYGWKQDSNGETFIATPFSADVRFADSETCVRPNTIVDEVLVYRA